MSSPAASPEGRAVSSRPRAVVEETVLQSKILRASKSPEAYAIYKAGLEYDLIDPIVIESRDDVKSTPRWRTRVEPFHHQVGNLISFCRRLPVTLLADDVGLGKTISAGLVMSELIARGRLSRALVVCPKLLGPQWKEELETKFGIAAQVVTGLELIAAEPEGVGAVITTYQTARTYLEKLPQDRFGMLVLDEAHKLRNLYGTSSPPQVAKVFHKALRDRRFRFVLMLTATPIHNRLWDLYSLVDLLTVARGHDNPFGNEGQFARKFIAGDRDQARHLKPEVAEQFRSIVYQYMSRVRRGDAKLHFPSRAVQLHRVDPTPAELQLIKLVGQGIRGLNRLGQIGILQALTSSPDALDAQLEIMARKGTVRTDFAEAVASIVKAMPRSAKLNGLASLIARLKRENPERWRLVIFTGRRETQTAIQTFLEEEKLKVGIINGTSGPRNQATLAAFRADPPDCRVIVSTEAGSEGVNLQVANVLVNYDLPWNPMIVEQRIGRVQRLGSKHASVGIFNIALKGTFEEKVIGRLMEKLQMSTSAIGDIESLLEGSVGPETEEGGAEGFEEKIRQLVLSALKGADVEADVRQREESIEAARRALLEEEKRIDELIGGMDGRGYVGPKAPDLPPPVHSMPPEAFARGALQALGAKVIVQPDGTYRVRDESGEESIRFRDDGASSATLYAPGTPPFARLVQTVVASGEYAVRDTDREPRAAAEAAAHRWVKSFGGSPVSAEAMGAQRVFAGTVLVRVRATVAHDAYERLVEVDKKALQQEAAVSREALDPLPPVLQAAGAEFGIAEATLVAAAKNDPGVAEFSRFYLERRAQEVAAAEADEAKRKKMYDDFTPRLVLTLVGAEGEVGREVKIRATYRLDGAGPYTDELTVRAASGEIIAAPELAQCTLSQRTVPASSLGTCVISGQRALRHLLRASSASGRRALPEHMTVCEATGQSLVQDEVERSALSGRLVARAHLRTSAMSGRRAEPDHFGCCAFSGDEVLSTELRTSDISSKPFRADAAATSALSRRTGHRDEFVVSSVSGTVFLPDEAVRSDLGAYCAPSESRACTWSGRRVHPGDLRVCRLTGVDVHTDYLAPHGPPRLAALLRLLDGAGHGTDRPELWGDANQRQSDMLGRVRCRIDAATLSPDRAHLALVSDVRTMLGLRSRRSGFLYSVADGAIVGRIALGKRSPTGWVAA